MESRIVHKQLNDNGAEARNALICYLQYLIDYRRDVPQKEEYIIYELQGLSSTKYVKQLPEEDPIYQILLAAEGLEPDADESNKGVWSALKNNIALLKLV